MTLTSEQVDTLEFGLRRLLENKQPSDGGNIEVTNEFFSFSASKEAIKSTLIKLGDGSKLGRRELRVIESYLNLTASTLSVKVIPEYDERLRKTKGADDRARLQGYQGDARAKLQLVSGLQATIQKELLRA
jgi:hypothetical protein